MPTANSVFKEVTAKFTNLNPYIAGYKSVNDQYNEVHCVSHPVNRTTSAAEIIKAFKVEQAKLKDLKLPELPKVDSSV
jgi:hypothetical protein